MTETPQKHAVGMVFGVFDSFHEGHRHFLKEAAQHCERLVVVVASPEIVLALKKRLPLHAHEKRMDDIRAFDERFLVLPGDTETGTWSALRSHRPDIVLLGYDQVTLGKELGKLGVRHAFITPHHPHKYKSSLMARNDPLPIS